MKKFFAIFQTHRRIAVATLAVFAILALGGAAFLAVGFLKKPGSDIDLEAPFSLSAFFSKNKTADEGAPKDVQKNSAGFNVVLAATPTPAPPCTSLTGGACAETCSLSCVGGNPSVTLNWALAPFESAIPPSSPFTCYYWNWEKEEEAAAKGLTYKPFKTTCGFDHFEVFLSKKNVTTGEWDPKWIFDTTTNSYTVTEEIPPAPLVGGALYKWDAWPWYWMIDENGNTIKNSYYDEFMPIENTPSGTFVAPNNCVGPSPTDHANFDSYKDVPDTMLPGEQKLISVIMNNDGGTTWEPFPAPKSYYLGSRGDDWGVYQVLLPNGQSVPPKKNEKVEFQFLITAPGQVGSYQFQWQMFYKLGGLSFWFDNPTTAKQIDVTLPNNPPSAAVSLSSAPDYCLSGPTESFSWVFKDIDDGDTQAYYQIQVDDNSDFTSPADDSGKVQSSSEVYTVPQGKLAYNQTYYWRLKVWDSRLPIGAESAWIDKDSLGNPLKFTTPPHAYPAVDFSWSRTSPGAGENIQFNDQSTCYNISGVCSSWKWKFQNGTPSTSSQQNPLVKFSSAKVKTATLWAKDADGNECSLIKNIDIQWGWLNWKEIIPWY